MLQVLEGVELHGCVNTDDETLRDHIKSAIRRGLPQIRRQAVNGERVCLIGGGPSLEPTLPELRQAIFEGAKVVTVNGAYHWCIERNIHPSMQIVMDARPTNTRFVEPAIPNCHYVLASQCHPSLFDAVQDREHTWIFHAVADPDAKPERSILDAYYLGNWEGIAGGTTVVSRAIGLLRTLGYLSYDLFGVDSCFIDGQGHAYAQPENTRDRRMTFTAHPTGHPDKARTFVCAPWHVKQAEDFLQFIRFAGNHFRLNVHGDGLIAYMMRTAADVVLAQQE